MKRQVLGMEGLLLKDGDELRFGLTWVDQVTGERCWKKSRYYFSEICKTKLVN